MNKPSFMSIFGAALSTCAIAFSTGAFADSLTNSNSAGKSFRSISSGSYAITTSMDRSSMVQRGASRWVNIRASQSAFSTNGNLPDPRFSQDVDSVLPTQILGSEAASSDKSQVAVSSKSGATTLGIAGTGVPTLGIAGTGAPTKGIAGTGSPSRGIAGTGISSKSTGSIMTTQGIAGTGSPVLGIAGTGQPTLGIAGTGAPTMGIAGTGAPVLGIAGTGAPTLGIAGTGAPVLGIAGTGAL